MKKSFFREPTRAQISRRNKIEISPAELDEAIDELKNTDNYILVRGILVPAQYDSHRKFIKHAPEIIARHPKSQIETQTHRQFPYQAKREALNKIIENEKSGKPKIDFAGWGFYPFQLDGRKRRILFTTDFEAAQLYAYAHQSGAQISVKPYADSKRVRKEGAEIMVEVPSRTEGRNRYKFKLMSVPVIDSPEKFVIAHNLGTNHSCPDVDFRIRYRFEDQAETSQVVNLDSHVGAAYLAVIDFFWLPENGRIKVPLNCGQFDIPTSAALEFYKSLAGRVLIQETKTSEPGKPNKAERNKAISDRLKSRGYNWMFFPTKKIDNQVNVRDYNWTLKA